MRYATLLDVFNPTFDTELSLALEHMPHEILSNKYMENLFGALRRFNQHLQF